MQLYTSGTTGHPKGAVLAHGNFTAMPSSPTLPWSEWDADDVSLAAMPCFHIGGTGWAIMGFLHGALNVVMREFDPARVLDFIERWRISKLFLVPAALQVVVRHPRARQLDYSQLKYLLYGASPDAARVVARVHGSVRLRLRPALWNDRDDGFRYGARSRGSRSGGQRSA